MELVGKVLQRNDGREQGRHYSRPLTPKESTWVVALLGRMAKRWSQQDMSVAIAEYLSDFQKLVAKYGMDLVEKAVEDLRIRPSQKFFPQPNKVAAVAEQLLAQQVAGERKTYAVRDCDTCDNQRVVVKRRENGSTFAVDCDCLVEWRRAKQMREGQPVHDAKMAAAGA